MTLRMLIQLMSVRIRVPSMSTAIGRAVPLCSTLLARDALIQAFADRFNEAMDPFLWTSQNDGVGEAMEACGDVPAGNQCTSSSGIRVIFIRRNRNDLHDDRAAKIGISLRLGHDSI